MTIKIEKFSKKDLAYGEVYQKLRKAKGFTQEEAAGHSISRPQLSNFESGKTMLSINHFFEILSNINVSMFEFQNAYSNHLKVSEDLQVNADVIENFLTRDTLKMNRQIQEWEQLSPDKLTKRIALEKIRVKSLLSLLNPNDLPSQEEITFIKNYLSKLKEWGQYDILLLGQCAQNFDPVTLSLLTHKMVDPAQYNIKLPYIQLAMSQSIINIIGIFVNKNQFNLAEEFIRYLEKNEIHEYYNLRKNNVDL